jgi:histidyl-tRNA synthetase
MESLKQQIKEKGDHVRALKAQKADQSLVDAEVAAIQELKKQLNGITREDNKNKNKILLKVPKVM